MTQSSAFSKSVSRFHRSPAALARDERGATMVEYTALLLLVFLPALSGALLCYDAIYTWYTGFVDEVSQPTP